jgi:molybdate transport system ATP-binding protein
MVFEIDVGIARGEFEVEAAFTAAEGFTALFGVSGAGKTTVLNMVAGSLTPRRGRIVVGGRVLFDSTQGIDVPMEQRRVGYVFQDRRLFPHMSVRANLAYGVRTHNDAAFTSVVELLALGGLLDRRPLSLSGGEQQRVAIGRALLSDPDILLMDEPLASLDARRKDEVLPYLLELKTRYRKPCLYVSHDREEIRRLADHVIDIDAGRITRQS